MTTFMAFSADSETEDLRPVYEGVISGGSVSWTKRLDCAVSAVGYPSPLRVTQQSSASKILQYALDSDYDDHAMYGYDGAVFGADITTYAESYDYLYWEEFDIHTSGLAVALMSNYTVANPGERGFRLKVSTDHGRTWGSKITIDYLYNLLGAANYAGTHTHYAYGMAVECDESTGTFYLLVPYTDPADSHYKYILMKSTNGTVWSHVKTWDATTLQLDSDNCSLAVSGSHLYAGFTKGYDYAGVEQYCYYSSNSGVSWSSHSFGIATRNDYNRIRLAANGAKVIAYLTYIVTIVPFPYFDEYFLVHQSTDGGVSWSEKLKVEMPDNTPRIMLEFPSVRASGDVFLVTCCDAAYPLDGATWTSGGEEHDMSGDDQPYLCFWLSADGGGAWNLILSPIPREDELGDDAYWQQSLDVSTAALRGCFWPFVLGSMADEWFAKCAEERMKPKCRTAI